MRSSGVLMHITSLPSPYGIGTMGQAAREFVDFLVKGGQANWQILPVCPTGYGDSPYQSFSTFAGNPYFIDLDLLCEQGLLLKEEYVSADLGSDPSKVDFRLQYENRFPILRKACARLLAQPPAEYREFLEDPASFWLEDYALFMALKQSHDGRALFTWEEPLRRRDPEALKEAREVHAEEMDFWRAVQYLFAVQWRALKAYANERGIRIIGDVPIYVSGDSADLWANPDCFRLDENLLPTKVAGCPPDGFSADGQLWGNPLFDWERMKEDGYRWWISRIRHMCSLYDVVRIDHFRGFAGYYAIPYGDDTARNGSWMPGPGIDFFRAVNEALGDVRLIAEDLGFLDENVRQMLRESGYPGMKVLEFAFDSRDGGNYRPHDYITNCIAYTGTHDNEPVLGWMETAPKQDVQNAIAYLALTEEEGANWGMMRGIWSSVADLAIVTAQDLLDLGHESRMNTPSTTGNNWVWRALPGAFTEELAEKLYGCTERYGRLV